MALIRLLVPALLLALGAGPAPAQDMAALRASAAEGAADAALEIGLRFDFGRGVARDPEAALRWYRRAAWAGSRAAMANAAAILDQSGRDADAALWFARAAALGHARSAFALGQIHGGGEGVPRNAQIARAWFAQAAAELPRAAELGRALPATFGGTGSGERPRPDEVYVGADGTVVLAWTAAEDPEDRPFAVEVARSDGDVVEIETRASAVAVPPGGSPIRRWRIARSGQPFGEWLDVGTPPRARPDVLILSSPGDAAASRLAGELEAALRVVGSDVRIRDSAALPGRSSIVAADPAALALARDLSLSIPVLAPDDVKTSADAAADVVVVLRGGPRAADDPG
ncbi:hypothetical protein [Jannaschia sp. LMIT008]|uniref:hypothetical protein n=1 Tax=Jannaschia maritima TaxID=3032585 RepID=UPI00281255A3|nr:hypothetical protein [Jannaschia sp. LMIT008]